MTPYTNNQIIHGDACTELKKLETASVDLIITDPPYLVNYRDRLGRTIANDDSGDAVLPAISEMARVLKDGRYMLLFCGWVAVDKFASAWTEAGLRTVGQIVWTKNYASRSYHTECRHESAWLLAKGKPSRPQTPVADVRPWVYSGNRSHPTEKAVEILAPIIRAYSQAGDMVLDPFSGSGSTSVAAALEGRNSIGIELEERYCTLARTRIAGATRYRERSALPKAA